MFEGCTKLMEALKSVGGKFVWPGVLVVWEMESFPRTRGEAGTQVGGETNIVSCEFPAEVASLLRKQRHMIVGRHSTVKTCHWTRKAILTGEKCYKHRFYGVESHRCIQMSPATNFCTHACIYCWRPVEHTQGGDMPRDVDPPELIVEKSIEAQKKLLCGFKGIQYRLDPKVLQEALEPRHVAISLAGEPTTYPYIGELIAEYAKKGFTTFLVTNGTRPRVLQNLGHEPTQLYLSVEAPTPELHKKVNRPREPGTWEKIQESLELLKSFSCPTVMRITLLRGYNLGEELIPGFSKLVEKAGPTYVEVKAYMYLGYSRLRLTRGAMPSHDEILRFAERLAQETGYEIKDQVKNSRVVQLAE